MTSSKMEKTLPLEERSIKNLYLESPDTITYVIPVYQRNFAWGEDQITELVNDVYGSYLKESKAPYYIGTLVTFMRADSLYEVIDGQQRLTTIYLLLKAMGVEKIQNKLTYSARKVSRSTLDELGGLTIDKLDKLPDLGPDADVSILNGYKFARKAWNAIEINDTERQAFKEYFLEQVRIIHYRVPKDVDLNHYFEVMNSRGEQLEKHEIVKSLLCECLRDKGQMAMFSRVWEACSEMDIYIQQVFSGKDDGVFSDDLLRLAIDSFDRIPKKDEADGKASITDLMKRLISKQEEDSAVEKSDRFQPIIDFPNFLLIVLRIVLLNYKGFNPAKVTLDDKELLNEFEKVIGRLADKEEKADFAKDFAFKLLKAKFFLDNFIVHHVSDNREKPGENPWKLQRLFREDGKKRYPKALGSENQDELVHLLSMFEVSFTPRQRKNYLFYCLLFLFDKKDEPAEGEYLRFLRNLADKYFYDVYLDPDSLNERNQPLPNAFDNAVFREGKLTLQKIGREGVDYKKRFEEIYRQGRSDIPLYLFNYTDYILWKRYADTLRGNDMKKGDETREKFFAELGCTDFELDSFNYFYFSRTRRSLEHYYPQALAGMPDHPSQEEINCFGNFAMIGAEANSSGSSLHPVSKLSRYSGGESDPVSVASLKFKIMMQVCQDNRVRPHGLEWNAKDMQLHQKKMLDIIIKDNFGTAL